MMQPGPAQWLLALHAGQLYGLCSHRTHQTQPIFSAQVLRTTGLWQLPSSSRSCCCCSASPAVAAELAQQMLETGICYILQPLMLNPISHVLSCPYPLHRAAVPDDDVLARMKHHVRGVLANLSAMMPCFALGSSKLPKVTGKKEKKQSCQRPFQGVTPTLCSLHCHQLRGNLHPLSRPTAQLGAGVALPAHPPALWGAQAQVSSPPQFPTTTQKSPSTPASLSHRQPRGFQTAPSPPPSTPTTRDPSTLSLPEKVM